MLQLHNHTPYQAMILIVPDRHGVESLLVVVKATFQIPDGGLAESQESIIMQDTWTGEPGRSALLQAHDLALEKLGTDIVLLGQAHAEGGRPTCDMLVDLQIGALFKRMRVVGDRIWEKHWYGHRVSAAQPFVTMPLTWDRAFGGVDAAARADEAPAVESRNPVGRGLVHCRPALPIAGRPLPNLEDVVHPITRIKDAPQPIGVGPLAPSWQPRAEWAGTYDERWQQTRAPYLPTDFDPRFFQAAPPDQVMTPHLRGGEPALVRGAWSRGELSFTVPGQIPPIACTFSNGTTENLSVFCDTLTIRPDDGLCTVVWRGLQSVDKRSLLIQHICIGDQHHGCHHD